MVVLNKLGSAILLFGQDFRDEYEGENPFAKELELNAKRFEDTMVDFHGKQIKAKRMRELTPEELAQMPSEDAKAAYKQAENEYIARRICVEVGYDEFLQYTEQNHCEYLREQYCPCDTPDGQCNFFCSKYGKCNQQ